MTYTQIVIDNKTNKAIVEWKENNWSKWQQESPAANIIEETNCLLILEIPRYETNNGYYQPKQYTIYGVSEKRIHDGFYIYWEPDLYHELPNKDEALLSEYSNELRERKIRTEYDLRSLKTHWEQLIECHSR